VSRAITRFEVAHAAAGGESSSFNTRAFSISVSSDGVTWTQVVVVARPASRVYIYDGESHGDFHVETP
jgi:hypothetical protein